MMEETELMGVLITDNMYTIVHISLLLDGFRVIMFSWTSFLSSNTAVKCYFVWCSYHIPEIIYGVNKYLLI